MVKKVAPTSKAKFVAFTSVLRPEELPGQTSPFISWPYVEGLRIDDLIRWAAEKGYPGASAVVKGLGKKKGGE